MTACLSLETKHKIPSVRSAISSGTCAFWLAEMLGALMGSLSVRTLDACLCTFTKMRMYMVVLTDEHF